MADKKLLGLAPLLITLLLAGCGSEGDRGESTKETPSEPPDKVVLADLLGKPRAELAALSEEWATRAQMTEKSFRQGQLPFSFLPEMRFPLIVPVLREARFASDLGISLPPYFKEGGKDPELALHLARYGDVEAARLLTQADDPDLRACLETNRYERNYPVEWSRLVGLLLHVAEIRLAGGEAEAVPLLIGLHQQLKTILDAQAARGPLGADLLSRGRKTLQKAVAGWRSSHQETQAQEGEAALAEWGEVSPPTLSLNPGTPRARVAHLLDSQGEGRVIVGMPINRALDLLDIPLPPQGVQGILACLDPTDRLAEILVVYRNNIAHVFPDPRHLALLLENRGLTGEETGTPGLARRRFLGKGLTWDISVVAGSEAVGALVRIAPSQQTLKASPLARDFGVVHLDRTFEQNRLRLAPDQLAATVQTEAPAVLSQVRQPIREVPLVQAAVQREETSEVTGHVLLRYQGSAALESWHRSALGLWAIGGPATISSGEDDNGSHLDLTWEDGRTRSTLRLPIASGLAMELDVADQRGSMDLAARAEAARSFDRQERMARLTAGKPLTRIPRSLEGESVELGQNLSQVQIPTAPRGLKVFKQDLRDGLNIVVSGEAPKTRPYLARQMFIRCDRKGRIVELRTRYGEGGSPAGWGQALVTSLKKRCGAAVEEAGPWARLWADLPAGKPLPARYRWRDDISLLTCQRDAWGAEVILRDAGDAEGTGTPLPPLEYLNRGPGEVSLGDLRGEVIKLTAAGSQPLPDGAVVVTPRTAQPYDALLVWFKGDRVDRIVARHSQEPPANAVSAQMVGWLRQAWGRDIRILGWPCRMQMGDDQVLQGLGWFDDLTRVRLFWQDSQNGPPRLYTEWRKSGVE